MILIHGQAVYEQSEIRTLQMIARRPDFLLPFRQKAPTMAQALSTIYSDHHRLLTPEGLWNILAFRGATYGSLYAKDDLQWFDTYEDWDNYYTASTNTLNGNKMQYFINVRAYGVNNRHRSISNVRIYWEERHRWTTFIKDKPDVKKVYKFLTQNYAGEGRKKVFPNIGPLTALLVCGDLIELKVLTMPSTRDWAELIYDVQKGATKGLQCLCLLGETFTKEAVVDAFSELNAFLNANLSKVEQDMMGYNLVMLEHGLCKFTRIRTKPEKAHSNLKKKPAKNATRKKMKMTNVGN
jgi:hypothetical protein